MGMRYCVIAAALVWLSSPLARGNEPDAALLEKSFGPEIRPLVIRYCQECHSEDRTEADVDLAGFAGWAQVRRHPRTWEKVGVMLESGQMPPKDAPQPSDVERTRLKEWVKGFLTLEAQARAGDPGRVVLRRLNNAEYMFTLRDLTGIASLDPAREFPADGAAGEGFTNAANALVMSPALIAKYLDAAREIADHLVRLPDGLRFSTHTTRRDWSDETMARIRDFYGEFTDQSGATRVNLQGIISDTNQGGRLPVEKYLAATIAERERLATGKATLEAVAQQHGLNARYLGVLWNSLTGREPSLVLDGLRQKWQTAKPEEAAALAAEIGVWQSALWKFSTVGHIGKVGGPKSWLEPVNPLVSRQEVRLAIPQTPDATEVTISLVAADAGDGNEHDFVVWQQPRLVAPGRPDLLLRDVRQVSRDLADRRQKVFANATRYLSAAEEAAAAQGKAELSELAAKHSVDVDSLRAWLDYLGIGSGGAVRLEGHFTNKIPNASGYDFITGWTSSDLPQLLANSSDQHVRVPGNMKPHSVAVHPSPTLRAAVGWLAPVSAPMRVEARVTHAHPECGNGVTWSLELRRGATRQRLATGIAHGATEVKAGPIENVAIQTGDVVSLLIGPRDGNHSCDLTAIDLTLTSAGEEPRSWNLADDVSPDVLAGNPHADRQGHEAVWHFYTEPESGGVVGPVIPADSLLAKWQAAKGADEKQQLAAQVQKLLTTGLPEAKESPDAALYRQMASLGGPLFRGLLISSDGKKVVPTKGGADVGNAVAAGDAQWGPDPAKFGKHPRGGTIDAASLCVRAPTVVEFRLPADLAAGCELVAAGLLDLQAGAEGSVQLQALAGKAPLQPALQPGQAILVGETGAARQRIEGALDEFRNLFPAALCYTKIVPVDEVVTLTLFYREDGHLARLMLDAAQKERLDRLWDELHYVSQDALTLVDAFAQLMEYATQDADPTVFEPLRGPINDRAAAFRKLLIDTEPSHLAALLDIAARAYRRPLAESEVGHLHAFYGHLRQEEIPHDEALRLTLSRVLVAPAFLYRVEKPGAGTQQSPVTDGELASRLSYFLWSSQPDERLGEAAAAGRLSNPQTLVSETRRMLGDRRTRRLATQFACQWLHIYEFDQLNEKSERHFPAFVDLRGAMYEESIRFFTDLFQNDGSVLDILDADHTFVNRELTEFYGLPAASATEVADGPGLADAGWRRVLGVKKHGRGGILAQATTLATQSGASRTSPILRGNWVSEVLLGERLPRPPKDVPQLPEDETATEGLTVRQLVEQHSSDPKCAICHQRIDAFGFSLESYDAIGRRREKDLSDRPIATHAKTLDGAEFEGLDGLRNYLLTVRRDAFVRQFCKKLLGFALGRAVQLSDEPLLAEMQKNLAADDYRFNVALEAIVLSRQFREIRGRDTAEDE
ncbi:MAG: DUF1592 domain-containing protein [Planctomycetaceae bacterium]|nr:DUF1592 domain-containing protein [Planctomycetaceae bacterium]